ncbi:MAG: septal ring lytic transglycosylase RlpA family protein [Sphingobacteriales bacterium]|nr:MAG: septal ring lytic transglycosylase RlpA family protein [Sphingobacteriales bacterium]TAF82319.1 MAG: septal ring lytic transglycosylase RlpA family protein [Sphingobacteriales bacterium]
MKLFLLTLLLACFGIAQAQELADSVLVIKTVKASYYANKFEGKRTTSGQRYRHAKATAAHKTLPLGTQVMVTNPANGKFIRVVINDRGPFGRGLSLDLSKSAAKAIGLFGKGIGRVQISYWVYHTPPKK